MAGRILNRRELRKQTDQAEQSGAVVPGPAAGEAPPSGKARAAKAPARKRTPKAKKAAPRMRARWGIFDGGMKQVAVFDYNERAAAEEKLADLRATKKGLHFLQIVKEPMPEPAPLAAPQAE
jgi:hypothetical protein